MSVPTPEARDIARYVTSFLKEGLGSHPSEVSTANTADGTPVDWHTSFSEIIAPTIETGYQLLNQRRGLELLGYAKILVDQFSEDTFLCLATTITTDDLEGLSWGRIVGLFTVLCLVSTDLAEKQRDEAVELLQEWLTAFLSREDLSEWVAKQGGWIGIRGSFQPSPVQERRASNPSWWQSVLRSFVNKVFGPSKQEQMLQKMEKELVSLREQQQRNTQQLNSKLGELRDGQLRQRRADLEQEKQLDRIEERVDECNDRQVIKWRAEQDRDDAQRDHVDGRIGEVKKALEATTHSEAQRTRKNIKRAEKRLEKRLEDVLRDKPHPPTPPDDSSDSSPDSLPPDVMMMYN